MTPDRYAEFLDHPRRPGPFGALMDECARAAIEFCSVAATFDAETFARERPDPDFDSVSPRAIYRHAISAARGYANDIRRARGLPCDEQPVPPPAAFGSPAEMRPLLADALRYTEGALEGLYDADYQTVRDLEFAVPWGPRYDPEMILEHGVVHLLRHRRQLENWA